MNSPMTQQANGPFEVTLQALEVHAETPPNLGRRSLDKKYRGDLKATARGEMLSAFGHVEGSAGYVAIEFVSGTLHGKRGTFVLQHTGTMTRGAPQLSVTVVPDSGTDELLGLAGQLDIKITDGKHFYSFDYTLPAPAEQPAEPHNTP